ncbi:hypothetical protein ACIHCM_16180 [Streptomyces sp. NPDC052023]|uniref:hypothetical protein n=1 Tax=Streptomyces sp. NPDC052023 TaxID=3365681 RepID=UPI0037D3E3D4
MSNDEKTPLKDQVSELKGQIKALHDAVDKKAEATALAKKADKSELDKKADKEEKKTFLGFDITHFTQEWKTMVVEVIGLKLAMDVIKFEIPSLIRFNEEALMRRFHLEYRQIGGERGVVERWARIPRDQRPAPPVDETDAQRATRLQREAQQAQTLFNSTQAQITTLQQQSQAAMQQIQSSATGLQELQRRAAAAAAAVGGTGGGAGAGAGGSGSG